MSFARPNNLPTIAAVVGIIKQNNHVLIAERPLGKSYSGYWEFPGGKIEEHESSETALKRELQEELGIEVLTASFMLSHRHSYPDKNVVLDIWQVESFKGEPKPKENQTLLWITSDDLVKKDFLLSGMVTLLDKIKSIL